MPGVPRVVVSRNGYDVKKDSLVNMSFDSGYNLGKICRVIKLTSSTPVAHGLPYAPRVYAMREISDSPRKIAWNGTIRVDDTNLSTTLVGDTATWVIVFVEPLENISTGYTKNVINKPVIKVGVNSNNSDANYSIHTGYDTLKVYKTGTLTINASEYDPGTSGGTRVLTATVDHNLGYIPMFGPFVDYGISLESYYQWNGQFNTAPSATWLNNTQYYVGQDIVSDDYTTWYTCIKTHTSTTNDKPTTGVNWQTYWKLYTEPDRYDTYLNKLEDIKASYGGVEYFNDTEVGLYATSTQLVLEMKQICYPDDPPLYDYTPCPAETLTVDYTIFYNRVDEEFNLLN